MHWGSFYGSKYDLQAMFWTLSSLLLLVLAAVPHVVNEYSMVGRTVVVLTLVRIDESAPLVVPARFLIKPSYCRLLLSIFSDVYLAAWAAEQHWFRVSYAFCLLFVIGVKSASVSSCCRVYCCRAKASCWSHFSSEGDVSCS